MWVKCNMKKRKFKAIRKFGGKIFICLIMFHLNINLKRKRLNKHGLFKEWGTSPNLELLN